MLDFALRVEGERLRTYLPLLLSDSAPPEIGTGEVQVVVGQRLLTVLPDYGGTLDNIVASIWPSSSVRIESTLPHRVLYLLWDVVLPYLGG